MDNQIKKSQDKIRIGDVIDKLKKRKASIEGDIKTLERAFNAMDDPNNPYNLDSDSIFADNWSRDIVEREEGK